MDGATVAQTLTMRRPDPVLRYVAVAALFFTAIALFAVIAVPVTSWNIVSHEGAALVSLERSGAAPILLDGASTIVVAGDGTAAAIEARLLSDNIPAERLHGAYWAARNRVAALIARGPITLSFADRGGTARRITVTSVPRRLADIPSGGWAALASGLLGVICGLWVWVLRPREWAARMFALMGVGLFVAGMTLAVLPDPGVAASGRFLRLAYLFNHAGTHLFGGAVIALFGRFPAPIVPRRWTTMLATGLLATVAIVGFEAVPQALTLSMLVMIAEFVLLVLLVAMQAWAGRRDPARRQVLAILGLSIVGCTTLYFALVIIPEVTGIHQTLGPDQALPLFLIVYLALGVAIARARLFDLGRWITGLAVSVGATVLVLLFDALLLGFVTRQRDLTLVLAVAAVGLLYLPVRGAIWRRAERRREARAQQLIGLATSFAFAIPEEDRMQRWRMAVTTIFDPLELIDGAPVPAPALEEDGAALALPAIADAGPLLLRHALGGRRLFDDADLRTAEELVRLVRTLIEGRDAYVQGGAEERRRIARDLHDDVGARLMTSLHRQDPAAMRRDVREAMADIRSIVDGLGGDRRPLADVLADLRYEAAGRLDVADIRLDWSPTPDERLIDYAIARHLGSVVRELTSNVVRHSGAAWMGVSVEPNPHGLTLTVTDDGQGLIDNERAGHGLENIAARAAALGGSFSIASTDGLTQARLWLPFPALPETGDRQGSPLAVPGAE
jgi:two-component system sensor histidine kinase DevS